MTQSLHSRKQQVVRDAIYDAAIGLFAEKGFDEVTVDEIVRVAGISPRSFFRYFATKDDLLAQSTLNYGAVLVESIAACRAGLTLLETMHEVVLAGVMFAGAQSRGRQVIQIATRSASARKAHFSRLMEIEDRLADAFASRLHIASRDSMKPRLLAALTLAASNVAISSWSSGENKGLPAASKQVFHYLTRILCDTTELTSSPTVKASDLKTPVAPRSGRSTKKS
jgi:AcrR family transcriptional regulator